MAKIVTDESKSDIINENTNEEKRIVIINISVFTIPQHCHVQEGCLSSRRQYNNEPAKPAPSCSLFPPTPPRPLDPSLAGGGVHDCEGKQLAGTTA
jgi:hypothetical protein